MIPPTHLQNVNSASLDVTEPISNHMRWAPHTASPSTLFRSNLPPFSRLNLSNRSDPLLLHHNKTDEEPMGEFLWRSVCCRIGIKDCLTKQATFCEYTWEVIACMVITDKGRSGPDIWQETSNQGTGIEDMIFTTWYKEAIKQIEINPQHYYPPGPSVKEACYVSYISFYLKNS